MDLKKFRDFAGKDARALARRRLRRRAGARVQRCSRASSIRFKLTRRQTPRTYFVDLYAEWNKNGFNRGSPKANRDPVGHNLTAWKTVEPGANPASMPRRTRTRASFDAADGTFRENPPQYRTASSCTARSGAAVRSIASEASARCPGRSDIVWSHYQIFRGDFRSNDQSNPKYDLSVGV